MQINPQVVEQFVGKMLGDFAAGYSGIMIDIGQRLGLYKAMAGAGPLSSGELARRTGCAERYIREWLNSQFAAGYLHYHPGSETYEMSAEQALVLADEDSPAFLLHAWSLMAALWSDEDKMVDAFRTGKGIAWGDHDQRIFCGVAAFYRNGYRANLVQNWLPALDGVVEKLNRGGSVADVGCGYGHSTILMAQAFPNARFWGYDPHEGSIAAARQAAQDAGVADRVTFEVARADTYPNHDYDLICFFDSLHDMGWPVQALEHARRTLDDDGSLLLVEPFAHDRVEDNANLVGRIYYTGSVMLCCAHAISEDGTHVLGAQAGEKKLAEVCRQAGFRQFRRATETPFNVILDVRR